MSIKKSDQFQSEQGLDDSFGEPQRGLPRFTTREPRKRYEWCLTHCLARFPTANGRARRPSYYRRVYPRASVGAFFG
jgi:hypothetical protein